MKKPWHFGNTTVRNPIRIRDGLTALYGSTLNGYIIGIDQEKRFADLLNQTGVVEIKHPERDYSDMGRKWRVCFSQLGFITHKFTRELEIGEKDPIILSVIESDESLELSGRPYEITPNGLRMIQAETIQQQQECMLRSLLAYEIPSKIELGNGAESFNPFFFILMVMDRISKSKDPRGLSKEEMALIQIYRDYTLIDELLDRIFGFRDEYDSAHGRVQKRQVEKNLLDSISKEVKVQTDTLIAYADVNFRYTRRTGLVSYERRRLVLNSKKSTIINVLLRQGPKIVGKDDHVSYLTRLWEGADLPTDDRISALEEINRFIKLLTSMGATSKEIPTYDPDDSLANLSSIRLYLEETYQRYLEINYARNQSEDSQIEEIIEFLKVLDKQIKDSELEVEDGPSYLEWAVWRAFLAINNLKNKPHESRRFKVDQDFLPLGCAPGGGPDLIFEFEDFVLVVEVTLTTSSRQEAAEGEPVRRHIAKEKAKVAETTGKPVYGLFLARSIDNNTAETFRIGIWYNGDEPEFINIVPITLEQFVVVMETFFNTRFDCSFLRKLLDSCLIPRNAHAPIWKSEINKIITSSISLLSSNAQK